jgi:hypothetical protein
MILTISTRRTSPSIALSIQAHRQLQARAVEVVAVARVYKQLGGRLRAYGNPPTPQTQVIQAIRVVAKVVAVVEVVEAAEAVAVAVKAKAHNGGLSASDRSGGRA